MTRFISGCPIAECLGSGLRRSSASRGISRSSACPKDKKADREADDPEKADETADSVAMANGCERCGPDYEQREATEEPEGEEGLPAVGVHSYVTVHRMSRSTGCR